MIGLRGRLIVAIVAAVMVAVMAVGSSAFAETPTPTPQGDGQSQDYRQVFLGKLATALGIDEAKLSEAVKQADVETIDEAVQNGDLAKNPAEQMKQRVQEGDLGFFGGFGGRPGGGGGPGGPGGDPNAMQVAEQAAADKLGLSLEDLRTQLRSGKSLSDLGTEKGVSDQDLQSVMTTAAKAQLDEAVRNGDLTQQQADRMLQGIEQGHLPGLGGGPRP